MTAEAAGADMRSLPDSEPYEMRITDHGRIQFFVSFALKFLQENPQRPLVLHTFPSLKERPIPKKDAQPGTASVSEPHPMDLDGSPDEEPERKRPKIAKATATIPRLVSVVEIIKREYGKWVSMRQAPDGGALDDSSRLGLHQYNELATLEDLGLMEPQEHAPDDAEQLRHALEGKNFLKQKFTPHLKVTLSVSLQPTLKARGATYQPPLPSKISKSTRARERRLRKEKEANEVVA